MSVLLYPGHAEPNELAEVDWLMTCLVTHGASRVSVDLDGSRVKRLRFQYRPDDKERTVTFSHPTRPSLLVARGRS